MKARYRNKVGKIIIEVFNGEKWIYVKTLGDPLVEFRPLCLSKLGKECLFTHSKEVGNSDEKFLYQLLSEHLLTGHFKLILEEKKVFEIINDYANVENYVEKKLIEKGFKIIKNKYAGTDTGHPDFIVSKDGKTYYIEVKSNGDGISQSQIIWNIRNPDKEVIYYWIKEPKENFEKLKKEIPADILEKDTKSDLLKKFKAEQDKLMGDILSK